VGDTAPEAGFSPQAAPRRRPREREARGVWLRKRGGHGKGRKTREKGNRKKRKGKGKKEKGKGNELYVFLEIVNHKLY
jgi:hypothetical protein